MQPKLFSPASLGLAVNLLDTVLPQAVAQRTELGVRLAFSRESQGLVTAGLIFD